MYFNITVMFSQHSAPPKKRQLSMYSTRVVIVSLATQWLMRRDRFDLALAEHSASALVGEGG